MPCCERPFTSQGRMDDTPQARERLTQEWQNLVNRTRFAGVPELAILETMLDVAFQEYTTAFGADGLGNLLRDQLFRLDQPVTAHDAVEQLIIGQEHD